MVMVQELLNRIELITRYTHTRTCIHSFNKYLYSGCCSIHWGYGNKTKEKPNITDKVLVLRDFYPNRWNQTINKYIMLCGDEHYEKTSQDEARGEMKSVISDRVEGGGLLIAE